MGRVVLTFKKNEKEEKIEEFLDNKVSASAYLKEVVWDIINGNLVRADMLNQGKLEDDISKYKKNKSEEVKKPKVGGFNR